MFEILKTLGMVIIVMACATGGTIGLIKLIKKVQPGGKFKESFLERKLREQKEQDK